MPKRIRSVPPRGSIPPGLRKRRGISLSLSIGGFNLGNLNLVQREASSDDVLSLGKVLKIPQGLLENFQKTSLWKAFIGKHPRRPEVEILEDDREFRIVVELPYHQRSDFEYEIKNGYLMLKSLLDDYDYQEKFPLLKGLTNARSSFKNNVFQIAWKKSPVKKPKKD